MYDVLFLIQGNVFFPNPPAENMDNMLILLARDNRRDGGQRQIKEPGNEVGVEATRR